MESKVTKKKSKTTTVKKENIKTEGCIKSEQTSTLEVTIKEEKAEAIIKNEPTNGLGLEEIDSNSKKRKLEVTTNESLETTVVRRRLRSGRER